MSRLGGVPTQMTSTQQRGSRTGATWPPILALSAGIAILVASEFLPASVLPTLAADVGVSEGTAGLAVAATAIAGALTAPSIAVVFPRVDRRRMLVILLALSAIANLIVAVSPNFGVLLVGRLVLGAALAGYWAFAFGVGTQTVPGRDSLVSAALASGVSVATVLGVPIASVIGDAVGWRTAFAGAAVLGALSAVEVLAALPPVPAHPGAGLRMMREALANRRLMLGILGVVLVAFGNFAAYPYIRIAIGRVEPSGATWLLLLWGVSGVLGPIVAGALASRLRPVAAVTPVLLALGLILAASADTVPVLAAAIVLWGFSFNMVPVVTQLWVTRVEPERAESAMGLQVTAFQVAITLGSAVGGALLDGYGIQIPLLVGACAAVGAGLLWALLRVPRT